MTAKNGGAIKCDECAFKGTNLCPHGWRVVDGTIAACSEFERKRKAEAHGRGEGMTKKKSKFLSWFELQFGPRPCRYGEEKKLRSMQSNGIAAGYALKRCLEYDEKQKVALYGWNAKKESNAGNEGRKPALERIA
jgi:hypothetical protein